MALKATSAHETRFSIALPRQAAARAVPTRELENEADNDFKNKPERFAVMLHHFLARRGKPQIPSPHAWTKYRNLTGGPNLRRSNELYCRRPNLGLEPSLLELRVK
ncbi:uncharacterized protein LTR77_006802 [Saxophila tyrrhenica]|uniref:Uncharacterized protein n=1 Tax=Saxophila tyrrhenica TaxID=1690608 RepID=A0AAV9P9M5_9PEZI|nr:hypothetical protein LTR77_006802 [Saxophila tyrrhenica]